MYQLCKDGAPVFSSKNMPTFGQFLMQELKPQHVWSITADEDTKADLKKRRDELQKKLERGTY